MHLKTFLSLISAMSITASLAGIATPARADDDLLNLNDLFGHDNGRPGDNHGPKSPRVVLISLDGAKPDFIRKFIAEGVLPLNGGLAPLSLRGAVALQNVTASPSLTAVAHVAIATGSTAEPLRWLPLAAASMVLYASGTALNDVFDCEIDRAERPGRPLPSGRIGLAHGIILGLLAIAVGAIWLALRANLLTGTLTLITAFSYVAIYTPLKRYTTLATFIGAFPGAMPPLIGWVAALIWAVDRDETKQL